ncbi:aldo/keto reductase [Streptomyces axinellae]|uniref:Aldo/keto reductase n=1 Tax=Streptomyces axinellae TaxID=552788 RepID=A0ABP6CHC8_9ACTN
MQMNADHQIGQLSVSPLALGGNVFGWTADRPTSFAVLDAYTEGGGNHIDTADAYTFWIEGHSGGESETVIGEWLAARGPAVRDNVVIATKAGRHPDHEGLSSATLKAAAEDSLRRLGTDHIDLYYTHFDDESVEVSEIVIALDDLVKEGKVREIAASNISPARLRASLDFSDSAGTARYVALQPHYNLVSRDTYEGELEELARRESLAVLPYFALAAGFLTGKYRPGEQVPEGARAGKAARYLATDRGQRVLAALSTVASAHQAAEATVALAWLASRPTVTAPIASARTVEQLPPLMAMNDLALTEDELRLLTDASA